MTITITIATIIITTIIIGARVEVALGVVNSISCPQSPPGAIFVLLHLHTESQSFSVRLTFVNDPQLGTGQRVVSVPVPGFY